MADKLIIPFRGDGKISPTAKTVYDHFGNALPMTVTSSSVNLTASTITTLTATTATITTGTLTTANVTTLGGTAVRTPGAITGTDDITAAEHANRVNIITGTSAATLTLPEATGTGNVYTFIFGEVNTNGTVFVAADTSNTSIGGSLNILDADSNAQTAYFGTSGDDTITINGTTTGGLIGDTIVLTDVATDQWAVSGQLVCPAGSNVADMFSST